MGMILLNGAMARLFLTCPHTHGDDPDDNISVLKTDALSPHAWG